MSVNILTVSRGTCLNMSPTIRETNNKALCRLSGNAGIAFPSRIPGGAGFGTAFSLLPFGIMVWPKKFPGALKISGNGIGRNRNKGQADRLCLPLSFIAIPSTVHPMPGPFLFSGSSAWWQESTVPECFPSFCAPGAFYPVGSFRPDLRSDRYGWYFIGSLSDHIPMLQIYNFFRRVAV